MKEILRELEARREKARAGGGEKRLAEQHKRGKLSARERIDVLLDHGANIEAPGSVIGGGTPMSDAVAFGQWQAARRLVERGARTTLWQAAALGLMDRVGEYFKTVPTPTPDEITNAFWCACHGGQSVAAEYLFDRGANLNWAGYDRLSPLDAANRSGIASLVQWLRDRGAKSAKESAVE